MSTQNDASRQSDNVDISDNQTLTGTFVLLSTGNTKILLPEKDVGTITYLEKNEQWHALPTYKGIFYTETMADNFFIALSDELKPMLEGIGDRFIAMPLVYADKKFMWCWQSAQVLMDVSLELKPLPEITLDNNSLMTHFIEYNGEIIFPCHADKLVDYALHEDG